MLKRSIGLCLFVATQSALAQQPAAQPAPARPAPAAAPQAPPAAQPGEPQLPQVTDDMLAPVPPAARVVSTWQEVLHLLRSSNYSLRTLQAREELASAQSRQVLAGALPSLTGDAGINYHILKGEGTTYSLSPAGAPVATTTTMPDPALAWQAGLNLRIPVLAVDTWHRRGTAEAAVEYAKLNTKAAERVAVAAVADAIVLTVTAERLAEVTRISLESALSSLDLYKRRAALGAASAIDVLRIEQEVSLSRSQVVTADDAVHRARENLGTTLGSAEPYGVTPNIRLDALAADAKKTCRPTEVFDRADVRAAEASVALSKRNESEVNKTWWPTIDAVSSLTYWDPESQVNNQHVTWSVGGVLSWNLYDGGLRGGTKDARVAETRVANEQLSDTKRAARLEVTQAFRNVKYTEATLVVAARTREVAAETARLSKISYLNGSGTTFDLVDTAQKLREAQVDYTIKEFDVLRARIAAVLALARCDI
ncbi:MAG TPA: TolC family protein [Polyangiaceae bacterium]